MNADHKPHKLIPYNPAHEVEDSSKVGTAQTCLRKYFFNHVLGWRPDGSNKDLDFGTAWHKAKEHLRWCFQMEGGYSQEAIDGAFLHFMEHYTAAFPTKAEWEENAPKDPDNAYRALCEYAEQYKDDDFKVHLTEVTGVVPISDRPGDQLYFKIDALIETPKLGMMIVDDKTASSDWDNADKFSMRFQFTAYIHAMKCYLGLKGRQLHTVIADIAVLRKPAYRKTLKSGELSKTVTGKGNAFNRIPIVKSSSQLRWWQVEAMEVFDRLAREKERLLEEEAPSNPQEAMKAYPPSTEMCFAYNRPCPYMQLCWSSRHPLSMVEELGTSPAPRGYTREFWNPTDGDAESCIMEH